MDRKEALKTLRAYNQTIHLKECSALQKELVQIVNEKDYFHFQAESIKDYGSDVETFLKENHYFKPLLKDHHEKLCTYLRHLHLYTCNTNTIRMDIRSSHFNDYRQKINQAIASFYYFYGLGLHIKDAIYGMYRQFPISIDFAPIITAELLMNDQEAIQYCKDVLTSENNTEVMTQGVIRAIEMSFNEELHDLLLNLFLAAKLQEGLRQSVVESIDEGQVDLFYQMIDLIHDHNLLRFSSVQRGILTWIGIGYEIVEEKQVRHIFDIIYDLIHQDIVDEALESDDPIRCYLGLWYIGMQSLQKAIDTALSLLTSSKRQIVACALIYLKLTLHFDEVNYLEKIQPLLDDEWIMALYVSVCCSRDYARNPIASKHASKLFDVLYNAAKHIKAQQSFTSKGFEWYHVQLRKGRVVTVMFDLMKCGIPASQMEDYLSLVSQLSDYKIKDFMNDYLPKVDVEKQKAFLIKEIIATSQVFSDECSKRLQEMSLASEDILQLESRLKTKKAFARANVIKVIAKQKKEIVLESYQRMVSSNVKTIQESAEELKQFAHPYFEENTKPKVKVLGKESGFGLYTPRQYNKIEYPSFLKVIKKGLFKKKEIVDTSFLYVLSKQEVLDYIKRWDDRIIKHANDEYQVRGSYHQVGERFLAVLSWKEKSLDALPLADLWRSYFKEDHLSQDIIFQLGFMTNSMRINYSAILPSEIDFFTINQSDVEQFQYYQHFTRILTYYLYECRDEKYIDKACQYFEIMNKYTTACQYKQKQYNNEYIYSVARINGFTWMFNQLDLLNLDDEMFKKIFPVVYETYDKFHLQCDPIALNKFNIPMLAVARAYRLKLIKKEVLMEMILDNHFQNQKNYYTANHRLFEAYRDAYFHGRGIYGKPDLSVQNEEIELLKGVLDEITATLLSMESTRLNEKTAVTEYMNSLKVIRGMDALILALQVLKGEELRRQIDNTERIAVFMDVIKHTYPIESDSSERLKAENIEEKRLVEVAMLAPQWIDLIQEVLGWDGFKEACFYFVAHMKQYDYQHKKAEISKYTDIEPIDLNDGAFDVKWCRDVYEKLGKKRFKMLYDAAKFLCENSFHTRARKYADATLGMTSKEDFLKQAKEKRNKDALNAYCICPIEDKKDLLNRYLYVQQFQKESKAFGSQRQASEKRSCEIAMMNLAKNSPYETVTRLAWVMESEMITQFQPYFEPKEVEEVTLWIEIDEFGRNEIKVSKKGKAQKSVPSKLKNHAYILEIKDAHQQLTQQYKRARDMLQKAMEERIALTIEELNAIMNNPVVAPMMKKLVLKNNGHLGFYHEGQLQFKEECFAFVGDIYIAHPFDMHETNTWKYYQEYLFTHQLVQPFKQIFRELYLKLEDEKGLSFTKRYSGYQIQPQKAAATLKSRRWNASYESGLERVYHSHNVIVNLMCDADWFSPSDIEAPSIDYVAFSRIKNEENQPFTINEIDDVLFSEMMRDVDLAVSTAYVGGVDPITSFSTIELRKAIVEYAAQLMKLKNITVQNNFVNIQGTLNNYHVHLGSGMIHQDGGGAIHMVPVFSGKRGKVYLPFLDEDPTSAQILTKAIMLAEDKTIKDPAILNQIMTNK